MIKLLKSLNHRGQILPEGTIIGLGNMEEKLIASKSAVKYEPANVVEVQKEDGPNWEDHKNLMDALEKANKKIEELQKSDEPYDKSEEAAETPESEDKKPEESKKEKVAVGRSKK